MNKFKNKKFTCLNIMIFIIIIIVVVFILIWPIVVNILFSMPAPIKVLEAQFTAGDLLSFVASALTLIGTISLSCVTIYLNKKQEILSKKPLLSMLYGGHTIGKTTDLNLHISNLSSILAINIFLLKYELYDYNNNLIKNVDYNKLIISFIEPMKTKPYTLNNIEEMTYGTKIIIYFKYNNTFSNEYYNKCIIILGKDGQVMFE